MRNLDGFYMKIAQISAENSYAQRNKVGAVLVKNGNILSFGYNGTPTGFDNTCEDEQGNTKQEVIHAEFNVIAKAARAGVSTQGSTLYLTLSPCFECAKLIIQSGITKVIYKDNYRILDSLKMLEKAGVICEKL